MSNGNAGLTGNKYLNVYTAQAFIYSKLLILRAVIRTSTTPLKTFYKVMNSLQTRKQNKLPKQKIRGLFTFFSTGFI